MKITHILWGLKTGGIETMLVDLANIQVEANEVSIIVINDIAEKAIRDKLDNRCHIYFCSRPVGSKNPYYIVKLNFLLYKLSPDIIHLHYTGIIKYIRFRTPKVLTVHNMHSTIEFNAYDKIIAISKAVGDCIRNQGHSPIIIPNGIPISQIATKSSFKLINTKRIVQVGRLYHIHKGQHITIEAMGILSKMFPNLDYTLDFIGDGDSYDYLMHLVKQYKLETKVRFLGNKSREYIYENLKQYDLLVQPSISEGFGLTVTEAMAVKLPVIISDLPSLMEVTHNERYAVSFPNGSAKILAEKIYKVLSNDVVYNLEESRQYVIDNYDIKNTAEKYNYEYKTIV